jgi:hypothetical protein
MAGEWRRGHTGMSPAADDHGGRERKPADCEKHMGAKRTNASETLEAPSRGSRSISQQSALREHWRRRHSLTPVDRVQ